eukprot:m.199341 g.199341  ORF g.199341 m.199341 type:complete len:81 (+) comp17043_c0_seq52:558-800(+)
MGANVFMGAHKAIIQALGSTGKRFGVTRDLICEPISCHGALLKRNRMLTALRMLSLVALLSVVALAVALSTASAALVAAS